MSDFTKTVSGILVPKKKKEEKGVPCNSCPATIWKHNEAGGRIFLQDGKPICAKCRIMKGSKFAARIRRDKGKFEKDVDAKEKKMVDAEMRRIEKIALRSQQEAAEIERKRKSGKENKK